MEIQILKDPMVYPSDVVLETSLGKNYKIYQEFLGKINEINLKLEWHYYINFGKIWICKILNKNKNMCFLSIWNTGFKLEIYFTSKTLDGIYELEINKKIKEIAKEMKPMGKLRPVTFLVENSEMINDAIKIFEYKMKLKK
ncbi:MAG: DUF3788 domain-containing protein [Zoogloeaceae bacterium]|jgi:hypothetical protein|nr:DUF3788 domain-containing protein [Zoogloeaceae bacterium]